MLRDTINIILTTITKKTNLLIYFIQFKFDYITQEKSHPTMRREI